MRLSFQWHRSRRAWIAIPLLLALLFRAAIPAGFMPVADARAIIKSKKWTWWRIAIGADGTWHTFRTYP